MPSPSGEGTFTVGFVNQTYRSSCSEPVGVGALSGCRFVSRLTLVGSNEALSALVVNIAFGALGVLAVSLRRILVIASRQTGRETLSCEQTCIAPSCRAPVL